MIYVYDKVQESFLHKYASAAWEVEEHLALALLMYGGTYLAG